MLIKRYLLFGAIMFVTVIMLALLNWFPSAVQKEGIRKYKSIEEVENRLKIKKIFLPSYFPQYLIWPPAEIYARRKPYKMVLMHFTNYERKEIVLSIRQVDPSDPAPLMSRIEPVTIKQRDKVLIKGRRGLLSIALCPGREPCNSVTWREEGYDVEIIAKDSVTELLKIAESMMEGRPFPGDRAFNPGK
jgi:hypothetical protein